MGYTPHVLVVGGGVTGTGIARDLALRGLEVTLVEKGRLTAGRTGHTSGLLHSGARFAETHPETARRCNEENKRLRSIASHCIEETGGLFLSLPADDDEYLDRKREACDAAGISVEELSGDEVQKLEPRLSSDIERGLYVPDASVDPFRLTVANARSAIEYDASIETHTEVITINVDDDVVGTVEVVSQDGTEERRVDYVVNAAGPWAGRVAALAGIEIPLQLEKGATVVVNDRPTEAVLNRCRPPSEGDLLVPFGERALLGRTETPIVDPDDYETDGHDVDFLLEELGRLVPEMPEMRVLRAFWGVRQRGDSMPDPDESTTPPEFRILDHEERDDLWGMSTVVGGTLTTYRLIAEEVADHVCAKFGIDRPCLTATRSLPGSETTPVVDAMTDEFGLDARVVSKSVDRMGDRARDVLDTIGPNPVVCHCESVTKAEIRDAIDDETGQTTDLDAVRIRTRASMGECQGGRCCHRIASLLYPEQTVATVDDALDDLYRNRWHGQCHALWGDQLAAAMRTYALHATTMNRDTNHGSVDLDAFASGPEWEEDKGGPEWEVP